MAINEDFTSATAHFNLRRRASISHPKPLDDRLAALASARPKTKAKRKKPSPQAAAITRRQSLIQDAWDKARQFGLLRPGEELSPGQTLAELFLTPEHVRVIAFNEVLQEQVQAVPAQKAYYKKLLATAETARQDKAAFAANFG